MKPDSERKLQGEVVRALSHPVRVQILDTLRGRVASPSELSREMDRSQRVIAYHANTLVRCGCLELVETKSRQGTVECFFAASPHSLIAQQAWRQAPAGARETVSGYALRSFATRARRVLGELRARSRRLDRAG